MKSTRADRIRRRINNLYTKLYMMEPVKYGKGNPYRHCATCNRSMIEVSYSGHYKGCEYAGIEKEIAYYTKLLEEA